MNRRIITIILAMALAGCAPCDTATHSLAVAKCDLLIHYALNGDEYALSIIGDTSRTECIELAKVECLDEPWTHDALRICLSIEYCDRSCGSESIYQVRDYHRVPDICQLELR